MKIYWLRDEQWRPVTCVAYEELGDIVVFQLATWNPIDNLSKKIGRMIATKRLAESRHLFTVPRNGHVKRAIMEVIAVGAVRMPNRARQAASQWLKYEDTMSEWVEKIANSHAL